MTAQKGFVPHITTIGTGDRPAVALHCTMAFGGAWKGLSAALPQLSISAPDMPSHGRSPDWDEQSDFTRTVYEGALAAFPQSGQVDVIGHSFGAATALHLAVTHPTRLRSLTVIEPVFFAVAREDHPEAIEAYDAVAQPFQAALQAGDREAAAREFNRQWTSDAPDWEDLPERSRAAMARAVHVVPGSRAYLYDDDAGLLAPDALPACTVPTLIIRGEHAHPAIIATNDGLAARMPNASQAVVAGAGHMAPITHPVATAAAILPLLERS
ncbi:Hydrolase, alpha/beta fold family [Sulfitobacter noctilucae]|uniref:alpha/beta fold hydrolase n=1 Tax=Sulfitobacter noctilucae TaxID=1342302 RepID=UPI000469BBC1|nr:alpha/beta hydrolase [Sulfitobacter noctilucae]KIN70776.1 Hydrolase, alpha/beta fold family [Sulfitobacter noctilucae]